MKRTYQSGSQKRKEKKKKELESAKCSRGLNAWLESATTQSQCSSEGANPEIQVQLQDPQYLQNELAESENLEIEICHNIDIEENDRNLLDLQAESITEESGRSKDAIPVLEPTSTDKEVSLCDVFPRTVHESDLKRKLIQEGPFQHDGPFPRDRDQQGRCFSNHFYTLTTKGGMKLRRNWLCYSKITDSVYCLPCWLFSEHKEMHVGFSGSGVRDWKHLTERIASHEGSRQHTQSCMVHDEWLKNRTVEDRIDKQYEDERRFWRKVIERILDVTLTLAKCNLAFRGSSEKFESSNKGNYLSIIGLLSKYDPTLQKLAMRPQGSIKYLSPKVQNELIDLLASHVRKEIITEIQSASFFSVIFDTTQDVSKVDQLSEVYRYVKIQDDATGKPNQLTICEVFCSFMAVKDQSAAGLADEILKAVETKGLDLSKCRGQGYDGASVMSGVYSGVQSRIKDKAPHAFFVHCAAHNLNLVLKDAVDETRDISQFYETVQSVYCFFGNSIVRWEALKSSHQYEKCSSKSKVTLKSLNPTRWAGRFDAVNALKHRFCDVLKCLSSLVLTSNKRNERDEAAQLKKKLESFKFVLLLVVQNKILEILNIVSKTLQSETVDLLTAYSLLEEALLKLTEMRGQFETFFEEASNMCQRWGILVGFAPKRMQKTKKHFDELCEDERLQDPKSCFRVTVFYAMIDTICGQLDSRFQGMKSVLDTYRIVQPDFILNANEQDLQNEAINFVKRFPDDISSSFPSQILSVRTTFKRKLEKITSVKEMSDMLIIDHNMLSSTYPDVCTACIMYLTVPVTVAKAERSFSKLKLIKNYLRNSMGEDRLSSLALLSIENERAKRINLDNVIDEFAAMKVRRKEF